MMSTFIDVDAGLHRQLRRAADRQSDLSTSAPKASASCRRRSRSSLGVSGPMLRASGVAFDLRKANPYCGYETLRVRRADGHGRRLLRPLPGARGRDARERADLPAGARHDCRRGRSRRRTAKSCRRRARSWRRSMEAVIHHFKLWTEGIRPPAGEAYVGVESPRGELGFYIVSDGSGRPDPRARARAVVRQPAGAAAHLRGRRRGRRGRVHRQHGPDHGRGRPMSPVREHARRDPAAGGDLPRTADGAVAGVEAGSGGRRLAAARSDRRSRRPGRRAALGGARAGDFYTMLHTEPGPATRVVVCAQLPCALRGAEGLIRDLRSWSAAPDRRRARSTSSAPASASARATARRWPAWATATTRTWTTAGRSADRRAQRFANGARPMTRCRCDYAPVLLAHPGRTTPVSLDEYQRRGWLRRLAQGAHDDDARRGHRRGQSVGPARPRRRRLSDRR